MNLNNNNVVNQLIKQKALVTIKNCLETLKL